MLCGYLSIAKWGNSRATMVLTVLRAAVQPDSRCGEATEEPAFSSLLHSERIPDQPAEPAAEAGHQQGGVPTLHGLR